MTGSCLSSLTDFLFQLNIGNEAINLHFLCYRIYQFLNACSSAPSENYDELFMIFFLFSPCNTNLANFNLTEKKNFALDVRLGYKHPFQF